MDIGWNVKTKTVYLLHFDVPIAYRQFHGKRVGVKHYMGSAKCLPSRLGRHQIRHEAAILRVAHQRGIDWQVVRTWQGDRTEERRLKRGGHFKRLCPKCHETL